MNNMDVDQYTISELMAIADIETITEDEIVSKTNKLILQFKKTKKNIAEFYKQIQTKLLAYLEEENQHLSPSPPHPTDNHVYISHIDQGVMNPLLRQTETKMLLLNSQNIIDENANKSNFVINLNTPLKNVINLRLHSYIIPFTWYNIDSTKHNNIFWITLYELETTIAIDIPSGNYTIESLLIAINTKMEEGSYPITVSYNRSTGKVQFNILTPGVVEEIIFFDVTNHWDSSNFNRIYKNCSLGWILGYRQDSVTVPTDAVIADCVFDLYGSRYIYLAIDDYKRNRVTNNVASIVTNEVRLPNNVIDDGNNTSTKTTYNYTTSPNNSDIMAVLPIHHNNFGDLVFESNQLQDYKREYYGPVNIDRLGVKLMDDTGNIINLNGGDWSAILLYEYIYQY
jgi:hypothetical protein